MVRYALLGYGKIAHFHAQAIGDAKGSSLVGVWGRNREKAERFATKWGIKAYTDLELMVKEAKVDAVVVTTVHPLHMEHTLKALDADLHVLVEKPMALTVKECDLMIEKAKEKQKKLGVISQSRWYPAAQRIRKAIDSGNLGNPILGQVTKLGWRDKAYYDSDPWRGSWETEGGGVLINQAPHQLDLLIWYLGEIKEVYAQWDNFNHPYIEVEDSAGATVRFANGAIASILVSNSQKPGIYAKVHVHGSNAFSAGIQTDGIAIPAINDLWTIDGEQRNLDVWAKEDAKLFGEVDPTTYFFTQQLEDFTQAIVNNREPLSSGYDGRETVKLIEGMYQSGRSGKPVRY